MPAGAPPRHRARLSRRARVVLCGLLVLPLLAGLAVYLTRGSVPAPASATGQLAVAPPASLLCDPTSQYSTRARCSGGRALSALITCSCPFLGLIRATVRMITRVFSFAANCGSVG